MGFDRQRFSGIVMQPDLKTAIDLLASAMEGMAGALRRGAVPEMEVTVHADDEWEATHTENGVTVTIAFSGVISNVTISEMDRHMASFTVIS